LFAAEIPEKGSEPFPVLIHHGAGNPFFRGFFHLHWCVLEPFEHGRVIAVETFDSVGSKVILKYLIVNIRQRLDISFCLVFFLRLMSFRHIYADASEFIFTLLIDTLRDPSEYMRPRSVAAPQPRPA